MEKILNTIKLLFIHLIDGGWSLRGFKFFCLKINGDTKEEWEETEKMIRDSPTLCKYFNINMFEDGK